MENIRNRVNMLLIMNCDSKKLISAPTKLSFEGIHNVHDNYTKYMIGNPILKTEEPIYLGFFVLNLSRLLIYET